MAVPGWCEQLWPSCKLATGIGVIEIARPNVRDRGATGADRIRFASAILPLWARRAKCLDALLPILYLRGISTGDFAGGALGAARQGCANLCGAALCLSLGRRRLLPARMEDQRVACLSSVRHGATQDRSDQGIVIAIVSQADGVQADRCSLENLASIERHKSVAEDHRRCQFADGIEVIPAQQSHAA